MVLTDGESFESRLREMDSRLLKKMARNLDPERSNRVVLRRIGSHLSVACRLVVTLLSGPLIGASFGFGLDRLCSTSPFLLLLFLVLGSAAGVSSAVRMTRKVHFLFPENSLTIHKEGGRSKDRKQEEEKRGE
ncbi:MAG: AtpZ/AtpI family protein [Alphaproteobacteria bacterium]|nr:AtpZ/AtpI family protein [Alphaproteobacteria bacterium]